MSESINPYASPEAMPVPGGFAASEVRFESGHGRAVAAMLGLGINALVQGVALPLNSWTLSVLMSARAGHDERERFVQVGQMSAVISLIAIAAFLFTAVAFLMWKHRAYRNLRALGAKQLRFTPAWVVGYYFIPIMNLFRPYQAMKEIALESDPKRHFENGWDRRNTSGGALIQFWWFLFLVRPVLQNFSQAYVARNPSLKDLETAVCIDLAFNLASVAAAVLALLLVNRIDKHQSIKAGLASPDADGPELWSADFSSGAQ
jgi:hypothetical protein